jgi:hypothetical protein
VCCGVRRAGCRGSCKETSTQGRWRGLPLRRAWAHLGDPFLPAFFQQKADVLAYTRLSDAQAYPQLLPSSPRSATLLRLPRPTSRPRPVPLTPKAVPTRAVCLSCLLSEPDHHRPDRPKVEQGGVSVLVDTGREGKAVSRPSSLLQLLG